MDTGKRPRYVKGKLEQTLDNFIGSINITSPDHIELGDLDSLSSAIASLHHEYLDKHVADQIIAESVFEGLQAHYRTFGPDAPPSEFARSSIKSIITKIIESIPRKYTYKIQMPSILAFPGKTFSIADGIWIEQDTKTFAPRSAREGIGLWSGAATASTVLCIDVEGYADRTPESPALSKAISIAKQIAFVASTSSSFYQGQKPLRARSALHDYYDRTVHPVETPSAIALAYGALGIDSLEVIDFSSGGGLLELNLKKASTEAEYHDAFDGSLQQIRNYFNAKHHNDFESVAAAIEWFHDSKFADNQTFSFIAACIGLEALVGSGKYIEGMTSRLADRFGFLMGIDREDREKLAQEYREVLRARGDLVHARTARLSGEHVQRLQQAQTLLRGAIEKELDRVYQAVSRGPSYLV